MTSDHLPFAARIGAVDIERLNDAAVRLHRYLARRFWNGTMLAGPDPGVRFNARIGRFVKNYLAVLPWSDDLAYMQAQGYWVLDNWLLHQTTSDDSYEQVAIACSRAILAAQHDDGHWDYPNPEWRGRVATVEGCFAALALLETYRRTGDETLLDGALRWHDYAETHIGFRRNAAGSAINYFAGGAGDGGGVPNNATLYLWLLASLAEQTNDDSYLARAPSLVSWLVDVQLPSGELPYALGSDAGDDRTHFLCFQYNAFEFLDLVHYCALSGDESAVRILGPLARYLARGITSSGAARYSCNSDVPIVIYYAAAIGQALNQATEHGFGDYRSASARAFGWVLDHQQPQGDFGVHSTRNYGVLTDRRSYPRPLSMILYHLLLDHRGKHQVPPNSSGARG